MLTPIIGKQKARGEREMKVTIDTQQDSYEDKVTSFVAFITVRGTFS